MADTGRTDGLPGPLRPRRAEDFDALYTGKPPWDIDRPQPAFLALVEGGDIQGRVLDVGCGTGWTSSSTWAKGQRSGHQGAL